MVLDLTGHPGAFPVPFLVQFGLGLAKGGGEEHWDTGVGEHSNLPKHELANFNFNQLQTASDAQLVTLAKLTPF